MNKHKDVLKFYLLPILCFFLAQIGYAQEYKEKAREYYKRGNILYEQGLLKEAEEQFQEAIRIVNEGKEAELKKQQETSSPAVVESAPVLETPARVMPKPSNPSGEYVVSEGDVLGIKVWQNEDLNDEVIVRPDGIISFPLLGEIPAEGYTVREFQKNLTEGLKEYIRNPQVSVSIRKMAGKKVIILGEVKAPGVYSVVGRKTILESIGLAGGFNEDAVIKSIILVRGGLANPVPQRLDLSKALLKGKLEENVVLESEDIVFVPKKFIADVNYYLRLILEPVSRGLFTVNQYNDL